jgi:hypothetical protein
MEAEVPIVPVIADVLTLIAPHAAVGVAVNGVVLAGLPLGR